MTSWAFIVGINNYPVDTGLKALHGAVADAAEFAEWALHPDGGAVAPENLYMWTSPAPETPPKRVAEFLQNPTAWPMPGLDFATPPKAMHINFAIHQIANSARSAGADRLYVFFAGHGLQTKRRTYLDNPQTCFVGADFLPGMAAYGLVPCDDMANMLKEQGPPEIVIFIDACRNDASLRVAPPNGLWDVGVNQGQHTRLVFGRAAQPDNVAYEVPIESPTRGAFSKLLIDGLCQHRIGGKLTPQALDNYVTAGIIELVKPNSQYPEVVEQPRPYEIILANGPPIGDGCAIIVKFGAAAVGKKFTIVGGPDNMREDIEGVADPLRMILPSGAYMIESPNGKMVAEIMHTGPEDTNVSI